MRGPKRGPKNLSLSFTEKWLRNAQPAPGEASTRYSDTACVGLCARVGKRRVVFYAKAGGRRYNIGSFTGPAPRWTLFEARQRCEEIRRAVADGDDPAVMTCTILTVREAFEQFAVTRLAKRRSSTAAEYRRQMEIYVFPRWGNRPVDKLTRADVVRLHTELTAAGKAPRANRLVATISSLYGWLQKDAGYTGANPASKIERNHEEAREIYLTPAQVHAVRAAIDAYGDRILGNDVAADCLRLVIATGCRSGEARKARWDQFDSDLRIWTKPASTTKQKKLHRVPLGPAAQSVLLRRRERRRHGELAVFPGKYGAEHIRQLRSIWETVAKAAGLEGVRIHDLRHTYASLAISSGVPLKVVGGLLGHASITTTNRYLHLYDDDLQAAVGKVSAMIEGEGTQK